MSELASQALRTLSQFLVAESSIGDTLRRIAEIGVDALPGADFAGVATLDDRGRASTAVFTDEEAPEIDQAQYDTGRGPCLDAWRTKEVIRIDDLTDVESRYVEFAHACLDHGIRSTLSLPLIAAGEGIGALNMYSSSYSGFTDDHQGIALELANTASVVLANAMAYWGAYDLGQQMNEAMQSRSVIEQAKGMLMARSPSWTPDDAFDLLRRASQRENVKLRDIAQRIVDREPIAGPE